MPTPSTNPSFNPVIDWLASQWFFLSALVLGAGHAARSQAKIDEHSKIIESLAASPVAIARLEEKVNHLVVLANEIRNK